ncbi:GIY-YIG nuclease family protein [Mycoplasma nasistruthionis]|uniref:Nucleotide excision repair endonuclease n=1 Tax=Mycoplasma nasistruthionis TaxID=353852 RepID=A0A5B7XV30_9MOLU|nr:nucleotide excision repair endonuclease [Mycoplasma nasistruthionis]QCZ36537.1 nucleotide excision repair endonuclease [Mycoplasma nasistruthionis]
MNWRERIKKESTGPGVYNWINQNGEVIYVGKAKNLRNRLKQYATGNYHSYKIPKMVSEIIDYKVYYTDDEDLALIKEKELIQNINPNITLH